MFTVKQILDRAVSVLLPKRCVLCGDVVAFDDLYCGKCEIPHAEDITLLSGSSLDGAVSPAYYVEKARSAVLRLKRTPDERSARFFAELMHEKIKSVLPIEFDVIIPIPMSQKKYAQRGFNQAELLARELGALMSLEVISDALSSGDFAGQQHKLAARDRMENAKKAYSMQNAQPVKGRSILLVDDVYTTGATMEACALLLKNADAVSVCAATATYTKNSK